MEQCITWSPSYTTLFMLYVIKQYNVLGASSYNGVQNFLSQGLNWHLLQLLHWQSMGVTKSQTQLSDWIEFNYGSESHHIHNPVHSQIKRLLLPRRKTMTNTDSILKSRDITLPAKVSILKAVFFPMLMLSHFSRVQLFATLWTVAHQAPLSMGFSRQEHWNGLRFPFWMWELDHKEDLSAEELMLSNCAGEDSWESLGQQDQTSQS